MKMYYYFDGQNQFGPMSLEELINKGITADTLIWFEGLSEWKKASEIQELSEVLPPRKPQINVPYPIIPNLQNSVPPKSYLVEAILVTILCCMPFGIVGIVYAAKVEAKFFAGDIRGAVIASAQARKWVSIAFFVGLSILVLYIFAIILGVGSLRFLRWDTM